MVVLLIIYVVFLVTREGDNTVSVDTIEKNITKAVKLEGMKKGTTQDLKKYYSLNANDYEGISLYIPDDVMSVNEILVIKVKNESQIETVEKAVESRVNTQEKNFEGYGVEQLLRPEDVMCCWQFQRMQTVSMRYLRRVFYKKELERCYLAVLFFYLHFCRL